MKIRLVLLVVLSFALPTSLFATITVDASKVPANGIQNLNYSGTFSASGGSSPYTFTVGLGFPAGLSLSSAGVITGHPTTTTFTTYTFTITPKDKNNVVGTPLTMSIYVAPSGSGMHNVTYPTGVGVVDVTKSPYLADNSGVNDASRAIQQAISDVAAMTTSAGSASTRDTIIFFPAGTYLVNYPLVWGSCSGGVSPVWTWAGYISLVGHSKSDTIIKLASGAAGFSSGSNPLINPNITPSGCSSISIPSRAVIFTAPNSAFDSAANTNVGNSGATGNTGFRNHIMNLTVDTGIGNTGAIGIDYLGSNNCRLSDVNIISEDGNGDTGLSMQRQYQGPDLIKYVTIAGFTKGIAMGFGYANWLEHIVLNRQTTTGINFASGDVATIRDLKSNNTVPAITNASNGASLSLIDSTLVGGSSGIFAVNNTATSPRVFIRNTSIAGSAYAGLASGGTTQSCGTWTEWTSNPSLSAVTSSPTSICSLNLAVNETPVFPTDDYTSGGDITTMGVTKNLDVDQASAISTAINSATAPATIYFPYGTYYIANPITINTLRVQRLIFFGSKLTPTSSGFSASNTKVIDIQTVPSAGLWIQNLLLVTNYDASPDQFFPISTSGTPIVLHEATATGQVTILNSENISYTSSSGAGTLYLESVNFGPFVFHGQTVYARHLNPELSQTHVTASGGNVWILGLKTENRDSPTGVTQAAVPIANVSNTSNFEVLGSSIYGANNYDTTAAMFTFSNSSVSISSMTTGAASGFDYDRWIDETRNGTNHAVLCKNGDTTDSPCSTSVPHSYSRPTGSVIPLYIGH